MSIRRGHTDERFRLYAKLPAHRYAVDRARRAATQWLKECRHPYLAFSGGKDSLVTLHLVREQAPQTPAIYFDADCSFPEVDDLLNRTPNLVRFLADEPILATIKRFGLDAGQPLEEATMQSTVYGPIKRLLAQYKFDAVAYGLRAEESMHRRVHVATKGNVFRYKRDGVLCCQPIAHWTYFDVWAFIASNKLDYCGVYDKMWDMPEREQRVSYWAGETNRQNGRLVWLKKNYPELWNRLAEEVPGARAYA